MANNETDKSKNKSQTAGKNTKNGSAKSAPKKNTPKKNTAKKETAKERALRLEAEKLAEENRRNRRKQAAAVILFCGGLLLFVCAVLNGGIGSVFNSFHEFHMGLWGFSAFVFPFAIAAAAYLLSVREDPMFSVKFFVSSSVILVLLSALWFLMRFDEVRLVSFGNMIHAEFTEGRTYSGLLGAVAGGGMYTLTHSKIASGTLISVVLACFVMLISRVTLAGFFRPARKAGKRVKQNTARRKEERKEREYREAYDAVSGRENRPAEASPAAAPYAPQAQPQKPVRKTRGTVQVSLFDDDTADERPFVFGKQKQRDAMASYMDGDGENSIFRGKNGESVLGKRRGSEDEDDGEIVPYNIDDAPVSGEKKDDAVGKIEESLDSIIDSIIPDVPGQTAVDADPGETPSLSLDDLAARAAEKSGDEAKVRKMKAEEVEQEIGIVSREIEQNNGEIIVQREYIKPSLDLLAEPAPDSGFATRDELKQNGEKLIAALASFNVDAKILDIVPGPSVTRYELSPASGVKINKFLQLSDDLALHLASPAGIRMEAPIPGKAAIGIEIPNRKRTTVTMREVIDCDSFRSAKSKLTVALGKDIAGNPQFTDIAKMPHLLIAGTTGSGKSVCLNVMLVSILYNAKPDEVKLLLIDPKTVEFSAYNGIPHLLVPVVNDPRKAAGALGWAVTEMLNRYNIFNEKRVRDIGEYNKLCESDPELEKMPQIVIVIDELSDLMTVAASEVEDSITRLAQMARAAGMHLVVATQRPSVDVITGLIKANIPSRLALSVTSQIDSRTILDNAGAEKLLGNGDMLFHPIGKPKPMRIQGCFISTAEIARVVDFVKNQEETVYDSSISEQIDLLTVPEKKKVKDDGSAKTNKDAADEEIIEEAIRWFSEDPQRCSVSSVQRHFGLGFQRAGRIFDLMETRGYIGPVNGSKPRQILITPNQYLQQKALDNVPEDDPDEE